MRNYLFYFARRSILHIVIDLTISPKLLVPVQFLVFSEEFKWIQIYLNLVDSSRSDLR